MQNLLVRVRSVRDVARSIALGRKWACSCCDRAQSGRRQSKGASGGKTRDRQRASGYAVAAPAPGQGRRFFS